jgi:hypothetical protein
MTKKGGGRGYIQGIPVKGIESFNPGTLPGLVLWIKADPKYIVRKSVRYYADDQLSSIKAQILEDNSYSLDESVITELKSDTPYSPNSLVRLELERPTVFPIFRSEPKRLDTIDMSNMFDPTLQTDKRIKLVTKETLILPRDFSSYSISHGITIQFLDTIGQILIKSDYVQSPHVTPVEASPTAEFSEILVFSRVVTDEEHAQIEGYLAYKRNQQYKLPLKSPYLPDYSPGKELTDLFTTLNLLKKNIESVLKDIYNLKFTITLSPSLKEREAAVRGDAEASISNMDTLRRCLSKAALVAREEGSESMKTIQTILEREAWFDARTPLKDIQGILEQATKQEVAVKQLLFDLKESQLLATTTRPLLSSAPSVVMPQMGGGEQEDAKTEDYELFMKQEDRAKEFYEPLKEISKRMNVAGRTAFLALYSKFAQEFSMNQETFKHLYTKMKTADSELRSSLEEWKKSIESGEWLQALRFLDTGLVEGSTTPTDFRDPTLQRLYSYYTYSKAQMEHGDYAFYREELDVQNREFNVFQSNIESRRTPLLFKPVYMLYWKRILSLAEENWKNFNTVASEIRKSLGAIQEFQTVAKQTGKAPTTQEAGDQRLEPAFVFPTKPSKFYVRRVTPFEEELTGIPFVVTDANGMVKFGDETGPIPFFPDLYTYKENTYSRSISFSPTVTIQYTVLEGPVAILERIPQEKRPAYTTLELSPTLPVQLSILEENTIQIVEPKDTVVPGILLPKHGLKQGGYICVWNRGSVHIPVQIPCPTGTLYDCVGPTDCLLYSFLGEDDEIGSCYSRASLKENYIPYDTVADCPRSSKSVFLQDMKKHVYVRESGKNLYEAVADKNGNYCEVIRHKDGHVYDADDVFHIVPYSVTSIGERTQEQLQFPPGHTRRCRTEEPALFLQQDPATGLAILSHAQGRPCMNSFGFLKCLETPLLLLQGAIKVRGATGDLSVQPLAGGTPLSYPFPIEPFLQFEFLFRSRFVIRQAPTILFYVTNSLIPIVSPLGTPILAETVVAESKGDITLKETGDTVDRHVFLVSSQQISITPTSYPRKDIQAARKLQALERNRVQLQVEFTSALDLFKKVETIFQKKKKEFEELGPEQIQKLTDILDSTVTSMEEHEDEIRAYEPLIQKFKNTHVTLESQQDISVMIEMVGVKLRKSVEAGSELYSTTQSTLALYTEALNQKRTIDMRLHYAMQGQRDAVKDMLAFLQDSITKEIHARGEATAPDMDALMKKGLEQKDAYEKHVKELEEIVTQRPVLVTEYANWYKKAIQSVDTIYTTFKAINQIIDFELPHTLQIRSRDLEKRNAKEAMEYEKQIRDFRGIVETVGRWIGGIEGLPDTSAEVLIPLKPGTPPKRGLTIPLPPFETVSNPSFYRNHKKESSYDLQLQPIRQQIQAILSEPVPSSANLGEVKQKMEGLKQRIIQYEMALGPILTALSQSELSEVQTAMKDLLSMKMAVETKLELAKSRMSAEEIQRLQHEVSEVEEGLHASPTLQQISGYKERLTAVASGL